MEVNIPLSTLPLQLEHAFVGCPLSFVRESLVPLGRRLTRQNYVGNGMGGPRRAVRESSRIDTDFVQIREIRVNSWTRQKGLG